LLPRWRGAAPCQRALLAACADFHRGRRLGLKVPDDLSLISFDNSPVVSFIQPQLTAIDQPIAATFSRAVELLIQRDDLADIPQPVVVDSTLIVRASTAPLAQNQEGPPSVARLG
ncbi:MAG: substrate-binding domain-containing protein, partial [Asticcacaulis sp.]